mgnify:CR=1 FL=1
MFQIGNTIRLSCTFTDFEGRKVDPVIVKVIIDVLYKKINECTLDSANKLRVGDYYFDYVPTKAGKIFCEWYGEIVGKPAIKTEALEVKFV